MKAIFEDSQFSFQTLRLLSEVSSGQADINEILDTAGNIREGNLDDWREEWAKTADRVRSYADRFSSEGHLLSAAETYLRASNYYRTATFYTGLSFCNGCGKEILDRLEKLEDKNLACFHKALECAPFAERVEVPFENTTLPGYYYRAEQKDRKPAPTLIMLNGFDGTKEEFYGYAVTAIKRGMNCLTLEGPGQGEVIHKMHLPFRPDYEAVITPSVDFLLRQDGVDPKRIALWGESFGGYLAPRAAAFEHRLAACVANTGVYDFMGFRRPTGISRDDFYRLIANLPEAEFRKEIQKIMQDKQASWAFRHGVFVFGAKSYRDFLLKTKDYYLEQLAERIECPTLIVDSENEDNFTGQAKKLYDVLRCQKDYLLFTKGEGAAEHCQQGAKLYANARIFDWLEDVLRNIPG